MSINVTINGQRKKLNLQNAVFLTIFPVLTAILLIHSLMTDGFRWIDVVNMFAMYSIVGMSVTAGYHRCFSHKAYECHPLVQLFYLLFGAAGLQNTALTWSYDHRIHHRYVDKEQDPYNISNGFFWAHMGWIYFDNELDRKYDNVEDLKKNKLVMWQHKYYLPIALAFGFGVPTLIGWFYGRPYAGFVWGGLVRQLLTHHSTFLINSAAHVFGKRPYSTESSARDSWWLAFLALGEGYHNFHHTFPSDYRNGIRWYQWDPTKWMIRLMSYVKLSKDLRRTPQERIQSAIDKVSGRVFVNQIKENVQ